MHKKLHQNIASVIASLIVIEGALLMSSCTTKSTSTETDEGQTIDEIIIQPDIQETTHEETSLLVDEPAVANITSDTWYAAEKTIIGPASMIIDEGGNYYDWDYYYYVRDFDTVYTGTDDAGRMYICETVSDSGSINVTVKDTATGDDIGVIDTSSVVNPDDIHDYYAFVLDSTPYLEVDTLNKDWEINNVEFYELNPDTMSVGEQVELFPEQNLMIESATALPEGICLLTREGRNYTENYIRIYDEEGTEISSSAIADIFGNDSYYYVETLVPWGEDSIFLSAIVCDDDYTLCSSTYYYGDDSAVETPYLPLSLHLETYYVTPEGEVYIISNTGISRLTEYGELEAYIDFNNVYNSVSGLRDSYIASINDDGSVSLIGFGYETNGDVYSYDIELDVSSEDYEDRTPIIIGVSDLNLDGYYYSDIVDSFNANNTEYYARLAVIESAPVYEVTDDGVIATYTDNYLQEYYEFAVNDDNHIIQELTGDSAPDVYLSSAIENNIIRSGALMDVSGYVDEYLSDNADEYFDNVIMAAANRNGELYQVPLKFYISGVFAGNGSGEGIVIEDCDFASYEAMIDSNWNGENPISSWIGSESYPIELIETHMNYYYDGENYDEDALNQLFDYLAVANGSSNYSNSNAVYQSIFSLLDLSYYTLVEFDDIDSYVTVPGPEGTNFGAVAGALSTLSIVENTDNLDGAIAFLQYALSYEAQMLGSETYGMPVNVAAYEDTNDELVTAYGPISPAVDTEEIEQFMLELIQSVDSNSFYVLDTRLGAILTDMLYNQVSEDSSDMVAEFNARYQE